MESFPATYSLMALEQDLPDELPSWAFEEDVLGGFDYFMDVDAPHEAFLEAEASIAGEEASVTASAGASTSGHAPLTKQPSANRPPSVPAGSNAPATRKQRQNREAQARFRERQRVFAGSALRVLCSPSARKELRTSGFARPLTKSSGSL